MSRAPNGQKFKTQLTSIARLTKRSDYPLPLTDSATGTNKLKSINGRWVDTGSNKKLAWQSYWNAEYARQIARKNGV